MRIWCHFDGIALILEMSQHLAPNDEINRFDHFDFGEIKFHNKSNHLKMNKRSNQIYWQLMQAHTTYISMAWYTHKRAACGKFKLEWNERHKISNPVKIERISIRTHTRIRAKSLCDPRIYVCNTLHLMVGTWNTL